MCTWTTYVSVHGGQRGCWMTWNLSYRQLRVTACECWELNSGPLEGQQILIDCWATTFPAPATHSFNQHLQSGMGWPQTTGLRNCWREEGLKWGCQLINLAADWWASLFSLPGNCASLESIAKMPISCQKLCWLQNATDVMQPDKGQGHKQARTRKTAHTEKFLFRLEKESCSETTHPLTTNKDGPSHLGRTYMVTGQSHHRMDT